ncbi:MAG: GntR family transcriptional regulator [Oscillospiraceae bacterium]|jgi:GntR family transcriptional regulator|nr:GntR family transcriptional regulator [Oscillospiraceae bacterium]
MFTLDLRSRKPIYEQVADNLRDLILTGVLPPGSRLPSVRELAESLTINPNTAQKAYRELESRGYVYSSSGLGTFVSEASARAPDAKLRAQAEDAMRRAVLDLHRSGAEKAEVRAFLDEILEGGIANND